MTTLAFLLATATARAAAIVPDSENDQPDGPEPFRIPTIVWVVAVIFVCQLVSDHLHRRREAKRIKLQRKQQQP